MNAQARRPGRRRWLWIGCCLLLALLIFADRNGWLLVRRRDDMSAYHGVQTRVSRVIDGDTLEVALPDVLNDRPVTRVRLWGIDCPKTARPNKPAELWAEQATSFSRTLVHDAVVTLYIEAHRTRGVFGRVLAHVELLDGSSLNEALLLNGLAAADDRWPHSRLTRYAQLENTARRADVGIWSDEPAP